MWRGFWDDTVLKRVLRTIENRGSLTPAIVSIVLVHLILLDYLSGWAIDAYHFCLWRTLQSLSSEMVLGLLYLDEACFITHQNYRIAVYWEMYR